MAVDMTMKFDGIKGESKLEDGLIDVLAWSWGMSQSGSSHTGGGGGSGKVDVQNLSFTKYIDKSTTELMILCSKGTPIKESLLTVRKAGDNPLDYIKITLHNSIVANINTGGSGGEEVLTENIILNFEKCKVEYTGQKETGGADATTTYAWDISKNKPF